MSRAARSILVFGIYLTALGAGLFVSPDAMLAIFRQPPTHEPWLRVLGLVSLVLGFYYIAAARADLTPFFRATLLGRGVGAVVFAAMVAVGIVPAFVLLMAAFDGLGALRTWSAIRSAPR